jgi:hypothetical protein
MHEITPPVFKITQAFQQHGNSRISSSISICYKHLNFNEFFIIFENADFCRSFFIDFMEKSLKKFD